MRIQTHKALKQGGLDMTLPIQYHALQGDATVRQIAGRWHVPCWLVRRVLDSAIFPDRQTPRNRSAITEPVKAQISSMIVGGTGPKEIWNWADGRPRHLSVHGQPATTTSRRHPANEAPTLTEHLPLPLAPLPINVRPRLGESTDRYIQRLARANRLRPSELMQRLTPPPHKSGRGPQLGRLAALSGCSADVLVNTLAGAGPAAEPTSSGLRLQRHPALHDNNGLRQIADMWKIPLRLRRRVLNPRLPDPKPPLRVSMPEDTYRTIWEHCLQGATPTQTWHNLLDDHVDWIPLITVTTLLICFPKEDGTGGLNERDPQTS